MSNEPRFNYIFTNAEGEFAHSTLSLSRIEDIGIENIHRFMRYCRGTPDFVARRQSLGMKDRIGRELFDGDIVRLHHILKNNLFLIEAEAWRFQFINLATGTVYLPEKLPPYLIEIVGDKYQTPELLENPIQEESS